MPGTPPPTDPPILLLPGFWLGSWCFSEVTAALVARGRRAVAVDLAGHGLHARRPAAASARPIDYVALANEPSPLAATTLDQAARLLTAQILRIGRGGPVTVVAHGLAGLVLTRVAQESPHLVAHAVYLAAIMPASGVPGAAYLDAPENRGQYVGLVVVADPAVVGAVRLDTTSPDPVYRDLLREAFCADVDPVVAAAALDLLSPDAPWAVTGPATTLCAGGWASVPRTYVLCGRDMVIRPALQQRFVDEADAAFPDRPVRTARLDAAHFPFLSVPDQLADIVVEVG